MTFIIREVRKEDREEITQLAQQMTESLNEPFLQALWFGLLDLFFKGLEKGVKDRDLNIFCAVDTATKDLVGMMVAKIELDRNRKRVGKTSFWYVKPSYRGKQIGLDLTSEAHEFFKQNNVVYTEVNIREDVKAQKIVEKLGFTKLFTRYRKYF